MNNVIRKIEHCISCNISRVLLERLSGIFLTVTDLTLFRLQLRGIVSMKLSVEDLMCFVYKSCSPVAIVEL